MRQTPVRQYRIIKERCAHPSLSQINSARIKEIKAKLMSRYGYLLCAGEKSGEITRTLIEETRHWLDSFGCIPICWYRRRHPEVCLPTHEIYPTSVPKEGRTGKSGYEAVIFGFWTDSNERPTIYLMVHLPTPKSRRITPNRQSGMHTFPARGQHLQARLSPRCKNV